MPVKINGSTSGSVSLTAPATGTDVTLTLPGSSVDLAAIPQANVANLTSDLAAKAAIANFPAGSWTAYTPVITASITNPTMGTGSTVVGNYLQLGKVVFFRFVFIFGSGSTAGNGDYRISLPITGSATNAGSGHCTGSLTLYDASTGNIWAGAVGEVTPTYGLYPMFYQAGTAISSVSSTVPWTWANGDQLRGVITYEAG